MTWVEFSAMFHERWLGYAIHDSRQIEFNRVTQSTRTVAEYEQEFHRLVHYVSQYHDMESQKMKRFIRGFDLRSGNKW